MRTNEIKAMIWGIELTLRALMLKGHDTTRGRKEWATEVRDEAVRVGGTEGPTMRLRAMFPIGSLWTRVVLRSQFEIKLLLTSFHSKTRLSLSP